MALSIAVCILVAAGAVYLWQQDKIGTLQHQQSALKSETEKLQVQYAAIQKASKIATSSWKQYCDPFRSVCFKYPATWKLESDTHDFGGGDKRAGATLTNPEKTVTIIYSDPLIKDGGLESAHVAQISDINISDSKLKIVGSYPVSSGAYSPEYYMVNSQLAGNLTPGEIGLGIINPRFDIGIYDSIALRGYRSGAKFTTSAQAEAWFNSVEGKTVKSILTSFGTK